MPILISGAIGLAIIIERAKSLFKTYPIKNQSGFFDQIQLLIHSGKTTEAAQLCDQFPEKPMAKVVKAGIQRAHLPENLVENGIEMALSDAQHIVQKRTNYLATIANVATLLGLFGTILGLIGSFEAVAHADPQQKSALLSAGIATAMNATMMGLGVAIPCMVAFSFLVNKGNAINSELENGSLRILDIIKQSAYAIDDQPAVGEVWENNVTPISNGRAKTEEGAA